MITINRDCIYTKGKYIFKNFIHLSDEEKIMVLNWRNHINIRKWMYSETLIEKDSHFAFIRSLNDRNDCFYWLVFKNDIPIGVFSVNHIDYQKSETQPGYYLDPENEEGDGFDFLNSIIQLQFEDFNVIQTAGGVLETNRYAFLHSLFLGMKIHSEEYIDGKKFIYGTLEKEDYYHDFEKKTNPVEFFKFTLEYKKLKNINNSKSVN
jgi:UDP-4-amino-4,6-dideoxy-N-acetyl-beta-L-altrosamine N-acetyltransferase